MNSNYNTHNLRKTVRVFACLLAIVLLPCASVLSAFAATQLQVQYSTDLSVAKDDWWDRGVQYGRLLLTEEGENAEETVLLATHCELTAGVEEYAPRYPICRSTDGGKTWTVISYVTDTQSGLQSEWNPCLYELTQSCGKYPAGTVVLAGCSVDADHSLRSEIRLYFSTDGGFSFDQGCTVAVGGGLENGVWEPFLMQTEDGRLVCFYSDDSDVRHAQKIVYKTSRDAENWSDATDVVASENATERPGMPVVTQLGDGSYFMVYEVVDKQGTDGNPVCYRRSADGLNWGDAADIGEMLVSENGKKALGSAPFCGWTPFGGENGTLFVSGTFMRKGKSYTGTDYFVSTDNGNTWTTIDHIIPYEADDHVGYSNSFVFSSDGKTMYAINNPQETQNTQKSKMVVAVAALHETEDVSYKPLLLFVPILSVLAVIAIAVCVKKSKPKIRDVT